LNAGFSYESGKEEEMLYLCRFISVNAISLLRHLNCNIGVLFVTFVTYVCFFINTQLMLAMIINPLNPELNPICYLLALLGAHRFLHVSRIRVKSLTFRRLMSYIYGAPILDVSRSHTTTQHSR